MRFAHHERLRAYNSIEQLVAKVRARDHELAQVARGRVERRPDLPDGYPRGGDGLGRMGGVSDPTGCAAEQREAYSDRLRQHADEAILAVFEALKALKAADAHCFKALEPPKVVEPAQRRPDDSIWCVSCLRQRLDDDGRPVRGSSIAFEPRTLMTARSRDDLCSWCLRRWEASSDEPGRRRLPDVRLVVWRADHPGRYLTERIELEVLAEKSGRSA